MINKLNYEVLLCCLHMALVFPVIVMALFVLIRVDSTPQLEITCDGTSFGEKHKYGGWELLKAVTNDSKTTYVTQARTCKRCEYRQFKKKMV